jgi:fatty acid desaturase
MQQHQRFLIYKSNPGPLTRIALALAAMVMAAVSVVLGFFFFIAFIIVALIVGIVLWFRLRPVREQMRQFNERAAADNGPAGPGGVIEGDFTVVREPEDKQGRGG